MRVLSLGCPGGRVGYRLNSFARPSMNYCPPVDREGHAIDSSGMGEDDTRLPSERLGANRPLLLTPVFAKPRRLTVGASA